MTKNPQNYNYCTVNKVITNFVSLYPCILASLRYQLTQMASTSRNACINSPHAMVSTRPLPQVKLGCRTLSYTFEYGHIISTLTLTFDIYAGIIVINSKCVRKCLGTQICSMNGSNTMDFYA
jgi:hypothetical protein